MNTQILKFLRLSHCIIGPVWTLYIIVKEFIAFRFSYHILCKIFMLYAHSASADRVGEGLSKNQLDKNLSICIQEILRAKAGSIYGAPWLISSVLWCSKRKLNQFEFWMDFLGVINNHYLLCLSVFLNVLLFWCK